MAIDEHFQRGHGPVGLVTADGFPWARLITGVVAVAISMTLGWQAEQPPAELVMPPDPRPAPAEPADPVEQRAPQVATAPTVPEAVPVPPVELVARAPDQGPTDPPQRNRAQRASSRAKAPSDAMAHRKARRFAAASGDSAQVARARLERRRAEVRNEYIAERERVAAFTGEDSGSAYLARMADRRRAEQAALADDARRKVHAARRGPARS